MGAAALPLSIGASALGTLMQMRGAKAAAQGQAAAARHNAAVAKRNAEAADIQAEHRLLINKIETAEAADRFRDLQSSLNVAYAKSGVMTGTGTAQLVEEENARQFDEEKAARLMAAETDAQAFREKGVDQRLEADLQMIYARNYLTAGKYRQYGAFISGVSKTASLLS